MMSLYDLPARYGLVSRLFHWIAAYLILWQFLMLAGWRLIGDGAFMKTLSSLGPGHGTVGLFVFMLVVPRALWVLVNRHRRPVDAGVTGRLARGVHAIFYLLMFVVPALALVRAYGSGKGFALWGVSIIAATGRETEALVRPANLLHGTLAWILAALVAGHVAMALYHGVMRRDGTLARMAGKV